MADGTAPASEQITLGTSRRSLDLATVAGLGGGLGIILVALLLGGSATAFFDLASFVIVFGGTLAATTIGFTLPEMGRTAAVVGKAVVSSKRNPSEAAIRLIKMSEAARRNGLLALQRTMPDLWNEPFLQSGLTMIIDGTAPEEVETIMRRDVQAMLARHGRSASVLRKASEVAPAMGLIGTLIGLVQMLRNLNDPSTIGPSMSVALLTTFYGAVLSNLVLAPLAAKLERNSAEETLINQVYIMGVVSIGRQENPRRLEMLLNSILPPSHRVQYFD